MPGVIQSPKFVYFWAMLVSILLSCLAVIKGSVINLDGICYLQSAESMPQGLSFAAHLCDQAKWPFYSIFIYGVVKITTFSYFASAHLLNAFFSLISVVAFLSIVRFLKGPVRVLWFAAIVILFAHEFLSVREYIIRDHGFWAFYLLSILFLLRFARRSNACYALLWSSSLLIASLFRLEAIFFLFLVPFAIGVARGFNAFLKLNVLTMGCLIFLGAFFLLHIHSDQDYWGRLRDVPYHLLYGFNHMVQHFHEATLALKEHVLNRYMSGSASLVWFLMMISFYVISVIANLSLIYAILVFYSLYRRIPPLTKETRFVLWSYVVINVIVTAGFFAENGFLSKRYLIALSLTLMIWVPFALNDLYEQWPKRRWPFVLAMIFIFISALGGIFDFGYSKKYIREAGGWINTHLPKQARLYSNDYLVMYYSERFGNTIFHQAKWFNQIKQDKLDQFDYAALRFSKNESKKAELQPIGSPIAVFKNKRGDEVAIYKIVHEETP